VSSEALVLTVDGIPVRPVTVEVAPGILITILDASVTDTRLEQAVDDDSVDPYASTLWPSSIALAGELPGLVSPGSTVLDLGAGTGLATLTAAHLGAWATAYDHDELALRLIEEAARSQGVEVETALFDLHSREALPPADLVVVADLFYDHDLAHAVARRVIAQVERGGIALVADPGRVASADFHRYLERRGLSGRFHTVEVSPPGPDERPIGIEIHLFGD